MKEQQFDLKLIKLKFVVFKVFKNEIKKKYRSL